MLRAARTLAPFCLFLFALPALSQTPELGPTNVYDLARGLRDSGHADLALEYLDSLTGKLPKDQQTDLQLERAKARLEQASQETAEAKRDDLIATAKQEFEAFLKAAPNHPRAVEANISLARLTTLLGKAQLLKAGRVTDPDAKTQEKLRHEQALLAKPLFEASSKQYAAAAKKLEDQANAAQAANVKRELTTGLYQALLDQAINQYYLGESYGKATGKAEVTERYNAYKAARDLFTKLYARDAKHPLCWVAKAWEGECNRPMQELGKAEKVNDEIKAALAKEPKGAPAAGYRMSRFFLLVDKWDESGSKPSAAAFQAVRKMCEDWLKDYRAAKLTAEHYSVMYYLAKTNFDEARLGIKTDPKTNVNTISDTSRSLLLRAERDFRNLTQTSNDYDRRAAKERNTVIRILVGEGNKPPSSIVTFDECHMTMLVALDKLNTFLKDPPPGEEDKPALAAYKKKKDEHFNRVIGLLNREKELPVPKESARDAANSQVTMIYLLRQAGRTYEAAVIAEALARTAKSSPIIAKAGQHAFLAYREAAFLSDPSDEESKAIDLARAVKIAAFLDSAVPDEPATEEIRLLHAKLLNQTKQYMESFDVLSRISLSSNSLVEARLLEGGVAYELLRVKAPTEAPANKKDGIRKRAIADLGRVPVPSKPTDSLRYVKLKLQLAQLYLTGPATGYPAAEKVVVDTLALIPTLAGLTPEDKAALLMQAEMVHIDTVYGQAMPMFNAGKFKECSDRFVPMLVAIAKAGPAAKMKLGNEALPGDLLTTAGRLDTMRLERLIMPSLRARARQGEIESCTELLDLARLFGGDLSKSVAAVYEVVEQASVQVEKLKAEKKPEDAKALMAKVATMVNKLLEDKNMAPPMKYNLAKACKDLGDYAKAIELLKSIPKPKNLDPKKPELSLETDSEEVQIAKGAAREAYNEEMKIVNLYRAGVLELCRVHRVGKMYPQGDALYDEILGKADTDKAKHRRSGWASNITDFRKEFFAYCEAKAADATAKAANPAEEKAAQALWVESIGNWAGLAGEYAKVVNQTRQQLLVKTPPAATPPMTPMPNVPPAPPPLTPEQRTVLEAQFKRLLGTYYDVQFETFRCTVAANLSLYAKKPDVLAKAMATQGKKIAEVESKNAEMPNEARARFKALLAEHKELDAQYKAAGGTGFPDKAPDAPKPETPAAGM